MFFQPSVFFLLDFAVDVKENAEAVKVVKKKDEDKADAACGQVPSVAEPEMPALIKSFPEPTRVKSPEQLVVRSPDPVNWTVPLDTAKTFTVTQNIAATKPQSELKVTMTVRPAPPAHPVAVLKPHVQQPQQHESAAELKEIVVAKEEIAEDRAQSPATSSAPTASSHSAPGTPPHDSLGYFSEPETMIEPSTPPAITSL